MSEAVFWTSSLHLCVLALPPLVGHKMSVCSCQHQHEVFFLGLFLREAKRTLHICLGHFGAIPCCLNDTLLVLSVDSLFFLAESLSSNLDLGHCMKGKGYWVLGSKEPPSPVRSRFAQISWTLALPFF